MEGRNGRRELKSQPKSKTMRPRTKKALVEKPRPNPLAVTPAEEIRQLRLRIQNFTMADHLWRNVLTASERECLGNDITEAYASGGTLGMWLELHHSSQLEGLLDLAHAVDLLSEHKHARLLDSSGIKRIVLRNHLVPEWDKDARELRLGREIIKHIDRPKAAKNVISVLDEFQRQGWVPRIEDPLPGGRNQVRLHATIRSLNKGLRRIKFTADGTGQGYLWQPLSNSMRSV